MYGHFVGTKLKKKGQQQEDRINKVTVRFQGSTVLIIMHSMPLFKQPLCCVKLPRTRIKRVSSYMFLVTTLLHSSTHISQSSFIHDHTHFQLLVSRPCEHSMLGTQPCQVVQSHQTLHALPPPQKSP